MKRACMINCFGIDRIMIQRIAIGVPVDCWCWLLAKEIVSKCSFLSKKNYFELLFYSRSFDFFRRARRGQLAAGGAFSPVGVKRREAVSAQADV